MSTFRTWMDQLIAPRGDSPEWPWLVLQLLTAEFERQRASDWNYAGEVFKDRDQDDPAQAQRPEKRAVKVLYHLCHQTAGGVLRIGEELFWLLGYEWPNQGHEKERRADLVGVTPEGGLVVFECKLDSNPYAPFAAVLEGLDYLACLTSATNFVKIQTGFGVWRSKPGRTVPQGFEAVIPTASARHGVVVLATSGYFSLYDRSNRGAGWRPFGSAALSHPGVPSIRFANSDFATTAGTWIPD